MQARARRDHAPNGGARPRRRWMASGEADYARLPLLIQRLLDAELIEPQAGEALLAEAEAGRRLLEAGDEGAARKHVERLATLTVALVGSGALDLLDGRAVIETVGRALSDALDRPGGDNGAPHVEGGAKHLALHRAHPRRARPEQGELSRKEKSR